MQILKFPHPILRHTCKPIKRIDQGLREIIGQMFETMYKDDGVGLAANQVGLPYRIFVINTCGDPSKTECEHVFINPVITKKKGSEESSEGCLSFPEIHAPVIRPAEVVIQGVGLDGNVFELQLKDLPGRAVQHETDHLNGVAFIDRLSQAYFAEIKEKLIELEYEFETNRRLGFIPSDEEIAIQIEELERQRC